MTVHARGYRPYVGAFGGPPAWWTILQANLAVIREGRALKRLGLLLLLYTVVGAVVLYVQIGVEERFARVMRDGSTFDAVAASRRALLDALALFYGITTGVVSLLAILTGAGLVADDLRARAPTLLMVRPIRAFDYALGKALVLPWVLLTRAGLPGLAYWLLVGAWQAPGSTQEFWDRTGDVPGLVATYVLQVSAAYAGLVLLVSSSTARRGVASALCAVVLFGGFFVYGMGVHVEGSTGELMRLACIPYDVLAPFERAQLMEAASRDEMVDFWRAAREARMPAPDGVSVLVTLLFVAGFLRVWWRARSVEVSE
jgi:hypothetical protein